MFDSELENISVPMIWFQRVLSGGGHIYKGSYEGWYSVPDEAFLSDSQVTDGPEPGSKVNQFGHLVLMRSQMIM